ncbi:MAG TPA: response regulator [Anaerolineae bacterium]|nr:response regulator [Anaerolineae bacterium]
MLKPTRAVLIIENDLATAEMYQRALSQHYQVFTSTLEQDVLALVSVNTPHAVVLEPGPLNGPGWSLLAELQRHPSTESIPVIVCTSQDRRRLGMEMGVAAYLVKPVLPPMLLKIVRRLTGEDDREA